LTVRRYFRISSARACRVASGISGIELCDDHHTLPPFFFIALPTHDVAPDKIKRPPQGRLSECYTGYSSSSPRGSSRLLPGQLFTETSAVQRDAQSRALARCHRLSLRLS